MKEKIAKLIDVKSIVTLSLTATFVALSIRGCPHGVHHHLHDHHRLLLWDPGQQVPEWR